MKNRKYIKNQYITKCIIIRAKKNIYVFIKVDKII